MLEKLFGQREKLQDDLGYCKLLEAQYNGANCTKMYFTIDPPRKYEFLKQVKHRNILPVYRVTAHSIFTKPVEPFAKVFDPALREYNKYVLMKLKETLDYIHGELKLEHLGLSMNALFVDRNGNVLLGNFASCRRFVNAQDDDFLLNNLSKKLLGRDIDDVSEETGLFRRLEDRNNFLDLPLAKKQEFIEDILAHKEQLMERIIHNLARLFLVDIAKVPDANYKTFVVCAIFKLNEGQITSLSKELFSILDTPIRMYLLRNADLGSEINHCVTEICQGLRVRARHLRLETVTFIFKNCGHFNGKAFNHILDTMAKETKDGETADLICLELINTERRDAHEAIYRLLYEFNRVVSSKTIYYRCLDKYFVYFDKPKISTKLLPMLCAQLTDPNGQDECFRLVERILSYLKGHKSEIASAGWSIPSIKGLLKGKQATSEEKMQERIRHIYLEEEDWEDQSGNE